MDARDDLPAGDALGGEVALTQLAVAADIDESAIEDHLAPALEDGLLERLRLAFGAAGLWEELGTDWACLDCELMPWSATGAAIVSSYTRHP